MTSTATTPEAYLAALPPERQAPMRAMYDTVATHLPEGFEGGMSSGMISWSVPHTLYPAGYHCDPAQPLPFVAIASQKHFIALYHMGMYAVPELLTWFHAEWPKHSKARLDMGKSCIRFKKVEAIPLALMGALMEKMSVEDWVRVYEAQFKR